MSSSEKRLILDLIQELQQYILTNQSGTTDMSSIQSNSLEIIQYEIEQGQLSVKDGLIGVIQNAQSVGLALTEAQFMQKIAEQKN